MDPGRLMGAGRAGLFAGVILVTVATMGGLSTLAWGGVALTALSLAVNSAGKALRYSRIEAPASHRTAVVAAWLLLVAVLFALVADYTYSQFNAGYEGYFWALAVAAVGLAMVYQGIRSKFIPGGGVEAGE